jgi:hypothetical protein
MPERSRDLAHRHGACWLENGRLFQGDHSLAYCDGGEWTAPETWEAIRKAAITAGTLMSLRN